MTAAPLKNSFNKPSQQAIEAFTDAAANGDIKSVTEFLDKYPSDINARNKGGNTALMLAVYYGGHKDMVALLLERDADVNASNNIGKTALQMAAAFNDEDTVKTLLENGASLDNADNWDRTALDVAKQSGYEGIMEMLKQWPEKLAVEQEARELAAEMADFSAALKHPIPAPRVLKTKGISA